MASVAQLNEQYSRAFQWEPETFGFDNMGPDFVEFIKTWQAQHRLTSDGVVGPNTFRKWLSNCVPKWSNHIIWNGEPHPLPFKCTIKNPWHFVHAGDWDNVVSQKKTNHCYRPVEPHGIVIHNALTFDAKGALSIFRRGSYLPHFFIENHGRVLYQLFDPFRYKTYHVGAQNGAFNTYCIGIDNINLLEMKWLNDSRNVHKQVAAFMLKKSSTPKKREYLALHSEQVQLCHNFVEWLCDMMHIHHEYPEPLGEKDGMAILGGVPGVPKVNPRLPGIWPHGMIQENRWDGFDFMDAVRKL